MVQPPPLPRDQPSPAGFWLEGALVDQPSSPELPPSELSLPQPSRSDQSLPEESSPQPSLVHPSSSPRRRTVVGGAVLGGVVVGNDPPVLAGTAAGVSALALLATAMAAVRPTSAPTLATVVTTRARAAGFAFPDRSVGTESGPNAISFHSDESVPHQRPNRHPERSEYWCDLIHGGSFASLLCPHPRAKLSGSAESHVRVR